MQGGLQELLRHPGLWRAGDRESRSETVVATGFARLDERLPGGGWPLGALVEICHKAEDIFNALRQGELAIDAALMDVVLRAYDAISTMFEDFPLPYGGRPPIEGR